MLHARIKMRPHVVSHNRKSERAQSKTCLLRILINSINRKGRYIFLSRSYQTGNENNIAYFNLCISKNENFNIYKYLIIALLLILIILININKL